MAYIAMAYIVMTHIVMAICIGELKGRGWPPYAAHIIIELHAHRSSQHHFVRVLYEGEPIALELCAEQEMCPLDSFVNMLAPVVLSDTQWDAECGPHGSVTPAGWGPKFLC